MSTSATPTTNSAFRTFAESLDSSTLFEIEGHLDELERSPGWTVVTTMLAQGRESLIEALTRGVLDHPTYANRAGYIAGLAEPHTALRTVRAVAENRRQDLERKAEADRQSREREEQ